MGEKERTRTFTWKGPTAGTKAAGEMSGLEHLRAIAYGELPAALMADLMGFEFHEIERARWSSSAYPSSTTTIPSALMGHGGLACTLADSAVGCAVHTMLPADVSYTTLEIKTNLIRAIAVETDRLLCKGKTVHVGRSVAVAEARLTDEADKLYAHATTTSMVFKGAREYSASEGER